MTWPMDIRDAATPDMMTEFADSSARRRLVIIFPARIYPRAKIIILIEPPKDSTPLTNIPLIRIKRSIIPIRISYCSIYSTLLP